MAVQFVRAADIGEKRYRWLEEHPDVGFADLVRQAIDEKMKKVE